MFSNTAGRGLANVRVWAVVTAAGIAAVATAVLLIQPEGLELSDIPNPVSQPQRGQIIVDPSDPTWLMRKDGGHLFLCGPGDPEDFLYRGTRNADGTRSGDQTELIRKLAEHGGNTIYMQMIRSHGGDGPRDHNPFVDSDPNNGLDEDILRQWEDWFTLMDRHGIVIYLFFYDDSARIWSTGGRVEAAEQKLIEDLVNRFEHHKNLIWMIAEEYQERMHVQRARLIAALIRSADDHDHVIGIHKLHGLSFDEFADGSLINQFAIQWNEPTAAEIHDAVVIARRRSGGRYNLNMAEALGHIHDANRKNWAAAMGGAYVMVYQMNIADTATELLQQCRALQLFFESTDFHTMQPRDDLAAAGTRYVLADPPRSYIAYADRSNHPLGIRHLPAAQYDFTWIDCENGTAAAERKWLSESQTAEFARPSNIGPHCAVWVRNTTAVKTP